MRKLTKGSAHSAWPTKPIEHTMCQMHDCVQENPCTPMNDTFMVLVAPPTTYGPAPNLI
jgi:hypothetical protein